MENNQSNLMEQLFRIVILLRRYQHHLLRERAGRGDPLRGQGRVLSLLKLKPEITQKELSYLLDMRNQSLGELLGKLERSGYITRMPSEQDRRVMNVKLTEAGSQAAEEMEKQQENHNKLFECLSDEEQRTMGEYLDRLIGELERQLVGAEEGVDSFDGDQHGGRGHHKGHGFGPRGFDSRGRGRGGHPDHGGHGFDPVGGRQRRPSFGGDSWGMRPRPGRDTF
ncbi:MarR family transcriptional regulator [Cohnella ginsengisoli]|uniref:MarR family transcriptional regulator n=1 Tax=Cohnella ginsengisoli TaxID=425004 RepID=A0A9X4QNX7_9BACL|nr:MarR family transcriptional regulator [Cohnella ginsengisoli]MDG0793774.1 MarR family transcriptional regulator [Cohnella ginsengisoli]